jgi:hypothetical protein
MNNNIDHIVKKIFQAESLEQVSLKQLNELIETYPSFNFAHYMLSKKMQMKSIPGFEKETQKTALYFTNQFWLQWLLDQKNDALPEITNTIGNYAADEKFSRGNQISNEIKDIPVADKKILPKKKQDDVLTFGAYYKIDESESESDYDSARNTLIENFATHSLEQKEVITETMAEVLVKQGKKERAVELYHKLSLLNPSKSAYFAAKIDQLK